MQITQQQRGDYLIIRAAGRLDATWADYFTETALDLIRNGHQQIIIDAAELGFLSSAGIRSLLIINKELLSVNGSFMIVHAQPFVSQTITMTGFKNWLSGELPEEISSPGEGGQAEEGVEAETYVLDPSAELSLSLAGDWQPWQDVMPGMVHRMRFPYSTFALGIGSSAERPGQALEHFGDFLAVDGHVIFQPPETKARPDFLLAEADYVPEMLVIQALCCGGEMSHLFRFAPGEGHVGSELSWIAEKVLEITRAGIAGMVILAEAEGLVGVSLIRSPGLNPGAERTAYPGIRDWLSFCGERKYAGQQALIFGIVARTDQAQHHALLRPLPSKQGLSGHFHAAVFPFQPLQKGKIELRHNVSRFLNGSPPLALMHLVEDDRPAVGLGQSAFVRGACWCSPIKQGKEGTL